VIRLVVPNVAGERPREMIAWLRRESPSGGGQMSTHAIPPLVALTHDAETPIEPAVLAAVGAALQKQVTRDFAPAWGQAATIAAFPSVDAVPDGYWKIVVKRTVDDDNSYGYHSESEHQPHAYVKHTRDWPWTASHELLEMLADPWGSRLVVADDPRGHAGRVRVLIEACDPCENFSYKVDGFEGRLPVVRRCEERLVAGELVRVEEDDDEAAAGRAGGTTAARVDRRADAAARSSSARTLGREPELRLEPGASRGCHRDRTAARQPAEPVPREERVGHCGAQRAREVRAALAPVEAAAGEAAARMSKRLDVDVEPLEPGCAGRTDRERVVASVEGALLDQSLRQRDAELAGEMVVAGASVLQRLRCLRAPEPADGSPRRDACECFECLGELVTCKPEEAAAADRLLRDEPSLAETAKMSARAGGRDTGSARELACGNCVPAEQGEKHRRAGIVREQRADRGEIRIGDHVRTVTL
jgi:hypothetical protein